MVGDADLAQEIVQETLLQAYLGLSTLREPAHFAAWLIGIAQNVCRTHLRARRRLRLGDANVDEVDWAAVDAVADPVAQLERQEEIHLIQQAIAALSPKNQAATWLYYIEAMSVEEVAQSLPPLPKGGVERCPHRQPRQRGAFHSGPAKSIAAKVERG